VDDQARHDHPRSNNGQAPLIHHSNYTLGRMTARLISGLGGVALIAGLISIVVDAAQLFGRALDGALSQWALGPLQAAACIIGALLLILLGQLASATFALTRSTAEARIKLDHASPAHHDG
jgi:hypothetical protein